MRAQHPFRPDDLEELDARLLSIADRVVPMRDVFMGDTGARVIGLRHDVDDNESKGSLHTALHMARWEFDHGYSSTYFLLHGSYYWPAPGRAEEMLIVAEEIQELGHEIGIHVNALAVALQTGGDPHMILSEAIAELRTAVRVHGSVAHGHDLCHKALFIQDEMFVECPRPSVGMARRTLEHKGVKVELEPVSREVYGLDYDANWLGRDDYLSDSGGKWSQRFDTVVRRFGHGQLHVLVHPDWWSHAFAEVTV